MLPRGCRFHRVCWSHRLRPPCFPPSRRGASHYLIGQLAWEDFERLCLRLLEQAAEAVHVSEAGPAVQATVRRSCDHMVCGAKLQSGIDVYARDRLVAGETPPDRRFVSLQARRIEKLSPAALRRSVDDFLGGKWASVSRKFIYATSASASSRKLVDEVETQVSRSS